METKICTKCGIEKPIDKYRLRKLRGNYIVCSQCKDCEKEYSRKYKKEHNKELNLKRKEKRRLKNIEKYNFKQKQNELYEKGLRYCIKCCKEKPIKNFQKMYYKDKTYFTNKCINCINKSNYEKNKEEIKQNVKKWCEENKIRVQEYNKKRRLLILEEKKQYDKEYYEKNKEVKKQYSSKYQKEHRKQINEREKIKKQNSKIYKLKSTIRGNLLRSFKRKNYNKSNKTEEITGLKCEEFAKYLLQTFKNNYGYEWDGIEKVHIDHIMPLKYAKTEDEVIKLCYYTNLQLLKAKDNMEKGAKIL